MSTKVRRLLCEQADAATRRTAELRAAAEERARALLRQLDDVQHRYGRTWDIHPAKWPWVDGTPRWWVAIRRPHSERPRTHVEQERTHVCESLGDMVSWLDRQAELDADAEQAAVEEGRDPG